MAEIAAPTAPRAAAEQDEERRRRAPPGKDATPEERARYELERKKVAKYKEDKLKARRDHTRMILESHAQAKRRQLLGKQSEFLANLEFRNSLPDLPFDTKFLQYPHERERLIKYKPNSLEMDYAYEVHEDATLGLMIDLIDPAKYEVPEKPEPLEVGDEQALMMKEEKAKGGRSKARPAVSWLRRTEYMGTDLYDAVHKFKSEVEIQSALREGTENALAEIVAQTLEDRAEASFRDINDPKTLVHPFNKKLKIAKVWDVLPDQVLAANKYAILSYDILPSSDIKSKSIKERETRALLTGISTKKRVGDVTSGSILLPTSGVDDENSHDAEKFSYYRDYQLSTENLESSQTKDDSQHCVFIFNPESNEFTYSELMYRVQLKKTKVDDDEKRRRGAIVRRREFSEGEKERRTLINFAYGGLYDDTLDDDEHTKEHKRRRTGSKSSGSKAATTDESAGSAEDEGKSSTPPPSPPAKKSDKAGGDGGDSPAISAASSDSDSD